MDHSQLDQIRLQMQTDAELAAKFREAYAAKSLDKLMALVKARGYTGPRAELEAYLQGLEKESDLSDVEMELVSAGIPVTCSDT